MTNFQTRFVSIRDERGYSQAALAKKIGVSRGVISNIEYGITKPSKIVINALCVALNVNEAWLVDGVGPVERNDKKATMLTELRNECSELSEPQIQFLLETTRAMKKYWVIDGGSQQ